MNRSNTAQPRRWRSAAALTTIFCLALAGGPLLTVPAAAQAPSSGQQLGPGEFSISTAPHSSMEEPELQVTADGTELSLGQAIAIALERNLTLVLERYGQEQFNLGIEQSKGIFDLRLDAFVQASDSKSPTTSGLQADEDVSRSESQTWNLGLAQLDPYGGEATVDFNNSRGESNNPFNLLNPSFDSSLSIGYSLPLLQNFGTLATQRGIVNARIQARGNREQFTTQVSDVVQQVINSYWALVEAKDQLNVAQEALELAQELHRRNQVQVEVGTLPPLELVRSEANIATQQEQIISSETNVADTADQLRQLLNFPQGRLWEVELIPTTEPDIEEIDLDLEQAITTALASRPELAQQRLELERLDIEAQFAENQTRPSLRLNLSYGVSGVGGDILDSPGGFPDPTQPQPEPQVVQEGGWSDALEQVQEGDFDNWSVGLVFAYPLQNRAARAAKAIADLDRDRGRTQLEQIEQGIVTEVRRAVRGVRSALEQIESARISRRLQESNLEAEQKRYENGMSTSFEITQVQEDLTQARSREVLATSAYRRAVAEYYRAVGKLLERTGIEVVDDSSTP